ncbi:MAG: amino acid adenylation domain-containing protein, partial [Gammaproteobacteria bacterium]|nr:amino acid adenylation domain-containing protein [Gammaproteobacteria bacterium]
YENHDYDANFDSYSTQVKTLLHGYEQSPLMIFVREFHDNDDVDLDFVYNLAYFNATEIERIQARFVMILEYVLNHADELICTIPLLTKSEQEQLQAWNKTESHYPKNQTIVDLFEVQVEKTPDNIAVVFKDKQLSYRELNWKANQLANYLLSFRTGADNYSLIADNCLVGICVERSLEMVIGLLGILKSGSAYVPLDPDYPLSRLQFMLEDSEAPMLLSQNHLRKRLPISNAKVVCLDSEWGQIEGYSRENPGRQSGHDNLAYVIYTSGSTGKPKGCQVIHSNVTRLFATTETFYNFNQQDIWTLFHSYAFDFTVWEIWGALLYGGKLVVVPYLTSRSPDDFYQLLIDQGVTVLNQTPSAFRQLINVDNQPDELSLRLVIFGGETLDFSMLLPWFARHGDRRPQLVNMYGITETTVHVTYFPLSKEQNGFNCLIGSPLPDLQVWVVDAHHQPVPIGVPGEMYVCGAGVTRGYLNRPELSNEKFIKKELFGQHQRLYKTGDLARWLPDGNLEYLGRMDNQVKLRGFRIELSEIEVVLQQHPAIQSNIVTTWVDEGDEKRLVAYLLPVVQSEPPEIHEVQTFLKQYVPGYMLPAAFVVIEKFPLNANGKIDYSALPSPTENRLGDTQTFVAPRTSLESLLVEIWQDVLKANQISIHDNFFELGGDSILSIRIVANVKHVGYALAVQDLFLYPTIAQLAQKLKGEETQIDFQPISRPFSLISETLRAKLPADVEDAYPLAALQAGMLFHSQYEMDSAVYHNVSSYHLQMPYDEGLLQDTIKDLSKLHPVLRTSFHLNEFKEPLQYVYRQVQIPFTVWDIRHLSSDEQEMVIDEWIETEKQKSFDLERAPLLRVSIHRRGNDTLNLTVTEHHAILDGWSVASLIVELSREYMYRIGGQLPKMRQVPPNLYYRDYIALEKEAVANATMKAFWLQQMEGASLARFPRLPKSHRTVSTNNRYELAMPSTLSRAIKQLADSLEVPFKTVLLAAHLRVINLFSGQTD